MPIILNWKKAWAIARTLIEGDYPYIHVLLDKFLFKTNSN